MIKPGDYTGLRIKSTEIFKVFLRNVGRKASTKGNLPDSLNETSKACLGATAGIIKKNCRACPLLLRKKVAEGRMRDIQKAEDRL